MPRRRTWAERILKARTEGDKDEMLMVVSQLLINCLEEVRELKESLQIAFQALKTHRKHGSGENLWKADGETKEVKPAETSDGSNSECPGQK